jgi:hypothetical protein
VAESGFRPGWRLPRHRARFTVEAPPSSRGSCRPVQDTREEGHEEILCRANRKQTRGYRRPLIHFQKAPASERALPYTPPLTRRRASERAPPLAPSPTRRHASEQGTAEDAEAPSSALPSPPSSYKRASTSVRPAADSSSRQWASTVVRPAADLSSHQQASAPPRCRLVLAPAGPLSTFLQSAAGCPAPTAPDTVDCRVNGCTLGVFLEPSALPPTVGAPESEHCRPSRRRLVVAPASEHRCPTRHQLVFALTSEHCCPNHP